MPLNHIAPACSRRLAAALLAIAVTAPAPAFAQGAGDDQYRDPFPETTAQDSQSSDEQTTTSGEGLSQTPPAASTGDEGASAGSTGADEAAGTSTSGSTATGAPQLARTGDDPWLIALAGGSLLLLGAGLRLRGGAQRGH